MASFFPRCNMGWPVADSEGVGMYWRGFTFILDRGRLLDFPERNSRAEPDGMGRMLRP